MIKTYTAIYNNRAIESKRGTDGLYHATIDGQPTDHAARYGRAAVNRAVKALQDEERTTGTVKAVELKEIQS